MQGTEIERQLIAASKQGDVASFNQLVVSYQSLIYSVCFRILGDTESAADASQDTFLLAFRKIRSFRDGVFRAWLTRVATNVCYDILRARKRRPQTSLDATITRDSGDTMPAIDPPDTHELPEETAIRHELSDAIQHALTQLPEDQRIAVVLSDIHGMNYQEIADATNANLGTIKSRLSRGRSRMRDILKAMELLPSHYRHGSEQ